MAHMWDGMLFPLRLLFNTTVRPCENNLSYVHFSRAAAFNIMNAFPSEDGEGRKRGCTVAGRGTMTLIIL